ncbi:MAG: hypothetical protein IPJ66_10560 [Bacteroidetes bacterium]|nr:hypothetical protein [Bacteroidota bacterium]
MDYTKSVDFLIGSAYRELEAQQEEIMTEMISCISIKDVVIRIYRGFRLGIFMECTNMDSIDHAGIREIIRKYTGGYMSLEFSVPKGFLRDEQKKSRKTKIPPAFSSFLTITNSAISNIRSTWPAAIERVSSGRYFLNEK